MASASAYCRCRGFGRHCISHGEEAEKAKRMSAGKEDILSHLNRENHEPRKSARPGKLIRKGPGKRLLIAAALLLPVLLSLLLANKVLVAAGVMEQGRNGPPFLEENGSLPPWRPPLPL